MLLMPLLSRACMLGLPRPPTTAATTERECKNERNECLQRCSPHAPLAEQLKCEQRCRDRYLECLHDGAVEVDGDVDWSCDLDDSEGYADEWGCAVSDSTDAEGELGCNGDFSDDDGWTSGDDGNDSGNNHDSGKNYDSDGGYDGGYDDDGGSNDGDGGSNDGDWGSDWGE